MGKNPKLLEVTFDNLEETGFFCFMSKKKHVGYKRKQDWLRARFKEGLQMRLLGDGERGFVEYIAAEKAWRPVKAKGYLFIHCLWVVGKSKKKGLGSYLLDCVIKEAKAQKKKGVAFIASKGNWLAGPKIFLKAGFEVVAEESPFQLLALSFGKGTKPSFSCDFSANQKKYRKGITVIRSDQCPYIQDASDIVRAVAEKKKVAFREVELRTSKDVQEKATSPFALFGILQNGNLLSYSYQLEKDLVKMIET